MKIVLNVKDRYVSSFKYIAVWFAFIIWVSYVYFFQGWNNSIYLLLATIFAIYGIKSMSKRYSKQYVTCSLI